MHTMELSEFLKQRRQATRLTQQDLADKAGVGLRFIREMEQGKATLRLDKVNQVLRLFGHEMQPALMDREKLLNLEILKKTIFQKVKIIFCQLISIKHINNKIAKLENVLC